MINKISEIALLQVAVQELHHCQAAHVESVLVHEQFQAQTVWKGEVEIFEIKGHPITSRCFAWMGEAAGNPLKPVVMLDKWPVNSPESAVKAAIVLQLPLKPPLKCDQNNRESWSA